MDYRLIACIIVMYKVISKIVASRLKKTMVQVIDLNLCSFVGGRLLLENVLLATKLEKDYHKIPSALDLLLSLTFQKFLIRFTGLL